MRQRLDWPFGLAGLWDADVMRSALLKSIKCVLNAPNFRALTADLACTSGRFCLLGVGLCVLFV
jgi:hypothetical protein